jgi:hypothetical protein
MKLDPAPADAPATSGGWRNAGQTPPAGPAAPAPGPAAPPITPPAAAASDFPTVPEAPAGAAAWAPSPSRSAGASRGVLLGFLATVVVLAAGAGVGWLIWGQGSDPADPATVDTASGAGSDTVAEQPAPDLAPPAVPTVEAPVVSPEEEALQELGALRDRSLQGLSLDQRWVAQVASKSIGITDPLQTAQNGSHTFYAVDILAESNAARATVSDPSAVLVLHSTDFGKRSTAPDGQPYWVTLFDGGFGSSEAVKAWCASTYPALDPAALANACAPRTLSPPHS